MAFPVVSIIIPAFNRASIIGETLDSIRCQTFTAWECIIVDDGSSDDTEEAICGFVASDSRFRFFQRPADLPKGANSCRNFGFGQSTGKYIIFFDSDDLMLPHKLEAQVKLLEESGADYCVARYANFDSSGKRTKSDLFRYNDGAYPSLENFVTGRFFWGTIDFLARREILAQARFNPLLKANQEYHFFISVLMQDGLRGCFTDEELSLRRWHSDSIRAANHDDVMVQARNKWNVYYLIYDEFWLRFPQEVQNHLLGRLVVFYYRNRVARKSFGWWPAPPFYGELTSKAGKLKSLIYRLICTFAILDNRRFLGFRLIKKLGLKF